MFSLFPLFYHLRFRPQNIDFASREVLLHPFFHPETKSAIVTNFEHPFKPFLGITTLRILPEVSRPACYFCGKLFNPNKFSLCNVLPIKQMCQKVVLVLKNLEFRKRVPFYATCFVLLPRFASLRRVFISKYIQVDSSDGILTGPICQKDLLQEQQTRYLLPISQSTAFFGSGNLEKIVWCFHCFWILIGQQGERLLSILTFADKLIFRLNYLQRKFDILHQPLNEQLFICKILLKGEAILFALCIVILKGQACRKEQYELTELVFQTPISLKLPV